MEGSDIDVPPIAADGTPTRTLSTFVGNNTNNLAVWALAYSNEQSLPMMQGEMINEAGTLTGGGGKPRGGRMCLGNAAPRAIDSREAATELAAAEQQLEQQMQVCCHLSCLGWMLRQYIAGQLLVRCML